MKGCYIAYLFVSLAWSTEDYYHYFTKEDKLSELPNYILHLCPRGATQIFISSRRRQRRFDDVKNPFMVEMMIHNDRATFGSSIVLKLQLHFFPQKQLTIYSYESRIKCALEVKSILRYTGRAHM